MEVYGHLTAAYLVMISNCNGIKFNAISMVRLLWVAFSSRCEVIWFIETSAGPLPGEISFNYVNTCP